MGKHALGVWFVVASMGVSAMADNPDSLLWSTFLGGSTEEINQDIATDSLGNVYVCGTTLSADFPATPGAFDTTFNGGTTNQYGGDTWVAKFDGQTGALIWATYVGGPDDEEPDGLLVNAAGEVILYGNTASASFPTTPGAYSTTNSGGYDLYLLKLSADGSALIFSTLFGGSGNDTSWEENTPALDANGNIYVTGITSSTDFPTTAGAFDTTYNGSSDVFVTKFSPDGSTILSSTYLGGAGLDQGQEIKVNAAGEAYITGRAGDGTFPVTVGAYQTLYGGGARDGFVAKLNASGSALVYSTFLGGAGSDLATGLLLDASGEVFVCGTTTSAEFPVTPGAYHVLPTNSGCFLTRLAADGSGIVASTRLWGAWVAGLERDADGSLWLAGYTAATDLPVTPTAYQSDNAGGEDSFAAQFSDDLGNVLYCSYIGGTGDESDTRVAADSDGNIFLGGWTFATDYPRTPGAADDEWGIDRGESFVSKIAPETIKVHYLTLFDAEMEALYAYLGEDYLTADLDADGLPDRYQAGLVAYVLSVQSHPYSLIVTDLYQQAIATLRTEPNYALLQPYEHILGALLTTSADMVATLSSLLSLTGSYPVFTITKGPDEPFSAQGDLDNDGTPNLVEYQNVLNEGYTPEESLAVFLESANDPQQNGNVLPAVYPMGLLALLGIMIALAARQTRIA